jgi:hypothetical protein
VAATLGEGGGLRATPEKTSGGRTATPGSEVAGATSMGGSRATLEVAHRRPFP